jgi:hypothetical protein
MTDWQKMYYLFRKPIWDPIPPWIKLGAEQIREFDEIQKKFNEKIQTIELEKIEAVGKVIGKGF